MQLCVEPEGGTDNNVIGAFFLKQFFQGELRFGAAQRQEQLMHFFLWQGMMQVFAGIAVKQCYDVVFHWDCRAVDATIIGDVQ